jgi:photosystem II stability/assembly factor-like uncharacterized protein
MKTVSTISTGVISLLLSVTGMQAAEPPATAEQKTEWQNISAEICQTAGLDTGDPKKVPVYMRNHQGLLVLPNGDVVILNNQKGMYRSTDQGATWTKCGEDWMKGCAQSSMSLKMYYPDRIGLTLDGPIAVSSDLGKSWVKVNRSKQTVFAADMDLSVNMPPKTILGFVHHGDLAGGMFVQTSDGGATWDWAAPVLKETKGWLRTGVVNASTLLRGTEPGKGGVPAPGIHLRTDLGQNWTQVSDYTLHGTSPVHYGSNLYWAAKEGIVVSRDGGKTWSVCGSAVANIVFGPYFGKSEQEIMVVSFKDGYSLTRDGGRSWSHVAPFFAAPDRWGEPTNERTCTPNDGRHWRGALWYFGWDSEKNILYESLFGGDAWKLQLSPMPPAR